MTSSEHEAICKSQIVKLFGVQNDDISFKRFLRTTIEASDINELRKIDISNAVATYDVQFTVKTYRGGSFPMARGCVVDRDANCACYQTLPLKD